MSNQPTSQSLRDAYKLVVEPRGDSFVPGTLLGPIGGAIDASVNENAGAFQMRVAGGGV